MAGLSKEQIIQWLREKPQTMNWGAILAFNRTDTNTVLLQEYINRFSLTTYLPPVAGYVPSSNTEGQYIHDYVMDYPKLSFDIADVIKDIPDATLAMKVVGGTQVTFYDGNAGGKEAIRIDVVDPLNGPELTLNLYLADVPATVNRAGQVVLDLKNSSNFRLTYSDFERERILGGEFFQALFEALPDEKRIMVISEIAIGAEDVIRPKAIKIRTQAAPGAALRGADNYGDGAVLVFVAMEGESNGGNPTADFKYLIANDANANYSATILLSSKLLMDKVVNGSIRRAFNYTNIGSDLETDAAGFSYLVLTIGGKSLDYQRYTYSGRTFHWDPMVFYVSRSATDELPAITFNVAAIDGVLAFDWKGSQYDAIWLYPPGDAGNGYLERHDFIAHASVGYKLDELSGTGRIVPFLQASTTQLTVALHHDPNFQNGHVANAFPSLVVQQKPKAEALIQELFSDIVDEVPVINTFVLQNLIFKDGSAVVLSEIALPGDVAIFGHVGPSVNNFAVYPVQSLIGLGESITFTTVPAGQIGLTWTVTNILGSTDDPGTINPLTGEYVAPSSVSGAFIRVKVTASRPGGYHSSALLSVVVNDITISPIIQTCGAGHVRTLSAGTKGTGSLSWSLKAPASGGSLLPDGDGKYVYTAPASAPDRKFFVEEVIVKNLLTGNTKSAYIMVALVNMILSIERDRAVNLPPNQVKLNVMAESQLDDSLVVWETLAGSGTVVNGIYTQPEVLQQRFVLLLATYAIPSFGTFHGYTLLPLPLFEYPQRMTPGFSFQTV